MARAYSDDLRRKLLEAHAAGKGTLVELAERFGVSAGWAWKISAAQAQTGSAARTPQGRRPSAVDAELVRRLVKQKPDIVLRELEEGMREHGQAVSRTQLWRVLKKLGLRLKKSRSNAAERDTEHNRARRQAFVETVRASRAEDLIYLDESGVSTQMTRLYGPSRAWPACRRHGARRTLENAHRAGCHEHRRHHGRDDHRSRHRPRRLPHLSRSGALSPSCAKATWSSWTTSAHTRLPVCANESRRAGLRCSTCRPTHLTSILSRKHGQNSSKDFVPLAHAASTHSNSPSSNYSQPSLHKTQTHGSGSLSILYS